MNEKYINDSFDKVVEEYYRVMEAFKEEPPVNDDAFKVERHKFKTEAGRKLYDLLIKVSDDNLFLADIFSMVKGDDRKLQLIKYLEEGERTTDSVHEIAERIELGIWGLSGAEVYDKYVTTETSAKLFKALRDIELIISNDKTEDIDYVYILRIMSLLETDEEREMLINTIIREIEKNEIPFKQFMNLIYLSVQDFYDNKHKKVRKA